MHMNTADLAAYIQSIREAKHRSIYVSMSDLSVHNLHVIDQLSDVILDNDKDPVLVANSLMDNDEFCDLVHFFERTENGMDILATRLSDARKRHLPQA